MRMQGNTILVAGGDVGIGRGLAELLHRLGNEVIILAERPGAAGAGLRVLDLDLSNPWNVAGFSEQVAAGCPGLNMLVNIAIAFPVKHLPGLNALLDADDSGEKLEARRLGVQQLTGALLPHFRKRAHSSVMNVSVGPVFAPPGAAASSARLAMADGAPACVMSVRKRWVSASIEVIDVAVPSRAERVSRAHATPQEVARPQFIASVAQLLAEGLQEGAAVERLRTLWPAPQAAARQTRDDEPLPQAH
ncbi:putative oxidoreductase [Pelomonas saccharophila]|uniref:Oxidoreductase n=1 Tax=Roseateles saccharophilus TaxID=304 RepID=A0ABU1YRA6_ROSSA|nr:SDR family NAD(P)-dependent oxidoreductase [Roseateles saccharophilus]MDR7270491.1 putative oxidoreductase [Roseateles saccharophilus]